MQSQHSPGPPARTLSQRHSLPCQAPCLDPFPLWACRYVQQPLLHCSLHHQTYYSRVETSSCCSWIAGEHVESQCTLQQCGHAPFAVLPESLARGLMQTAGGCLPTWHVSSLCCCIVWWELLIGLPSWFPVGFLQADVLVLGPSTGLVRLSWRAIPLLWVRGCAACVVYSWLCSLLLMPGCIPGQAAARDGQARLPMRAHCRRRCRASQRLLILRGCCIRPVIALPACHRCAARTLCFLVA